jgi:adhesin/invasin
LDAYGNVDTNYTGTVQLSSSDPQAALDSDHTFSAADAGQYSFYVVLNTAGTNWIMATDTASLSITGMEDGIIVSLP